MKLKDNIIKGVIIACFLWGATNLHAQGLFSSNGNTTKSNDNTTNTSTSRSGGLFRNDDDPGSGDDDTGTTGDGKTPAPGDDSPIGEGLVILSLLSGAYALVKKKNIRNRNEK